MNIRLLCKQLSVLCFLIGIFMLLSLPWAWPAWGRRYGIDDHYSFEQRGFWALIISAAICAVVGGVLYRIGRYASGTMFRKEAMAIVGLSWILATVLGAMPYLLSTTYRGPAARVFSADERPQVVALANWRFLTTWQEVEPLSPEQYQVIAALCSDEAKAKGLNRRRLIALSDRLDAVQIFRELQLLPDWSRVLVAAGESRRLVPSDRDNHYRIRWVPMTVMDALFEAQSGFSTTGATVLAELEDDHLVPYCILFWRSSTQFLGGLGIIVLFVVILGQGSAGKALMRNEYTAYSQEGMSARMQHTAWVFAGIYAALTMILIVCLMVIGITAFDAICHAFTTVSTGGFSTYNASIGHFAGWDPARGAAIETIITLFMVLGGTNFLLFYLCLLKQPWKLFNDIEWRAYLGIIFVVATVVVLAGMINRDTGYETVISAIRYSLFQVVSIITTTGYSTTDFDQWNQFSRGLILVLIFSGGCAGSTAGGMKIIRHVLFAKILSLEIGRTFSPRLVRVLKVGGQTVDDQQLRLSILVYVGLILALFIGGTLFILAFEPRTTFAPNQSHQIFDSASAIAATLNNVGPGLGAVGPNQNFGNFSGMTKMLFVWLMMLGRLEIFPIIVLFFPRFWRDQ